MLRNFLVSQVHHSAMAEVITSSVKGAWQTTKLCRRSTNCTDVCQ